MLFTLILIATILALAYLRASLQQATLAIAVVLIAGTLLEAAGTGLLILYWLLALAVLVPLNHRPLRRQLISAPALTLFRKVLPRMSDTEREALEAGDTWWDAELFSGRPDWNRLQSFPVKPLSPEEQAFLDGPVEELCRMLDDWQVTREQQDLPPAVWEFLKKERFFGMIIPKEYGGLEFSARGHSEVVVKVATRSITAAVTVMVPNSLGPGALLMKYGTQAQKDHYLPRLANGEEVPCFALTGPEAGSDAGAMPDTGIVCRREFRGEQEVLGILLNWEKRYITLGPVATVLGLAFKLRDPDHLLGDREEIGITLALIPTDTPGVEIGDRHIPLDIPFQNGPNYGRDVFIPMDWVIGGAERAGQGWRMLMECLAEGRGVSLPALSAAAGKLACRTTGAYARVRRQFKTPIGRFEGVEEAMGRIGGLSYLIDAARILTLGALDAGIHPSVITAIVKYHATESMRRVVNDAMDVHGGKGIVLGPRNYLGRIYQSVPVSITVEGANILTRNMIIYGQGAIRCHPFVLREMEAAAGDDEQSLERFDEALFGHLGFTLSNGARALLLGLSNAHLAGTPAGPDRRAWQQLSRFSAVLALLSDVSMGLLGGSLKRRERVSARLGDILSHLYLASALLKKHHDAGSPADERPLLEWGLAWCLHQMERATAELLENYPNRLVGRLLKWLVLPLGRRLPPPDDRHDHEVARLLQEPGPVRDRLTSGMFLPQEQGEALAVLEQALQLTLKAEPIERRLQQALKQGEIAADTPDGMVEAALQAGVISPGEADTLKAARAAMREVIAVDAFPKSEVVGSRPVRKKTTRKKTTRKKTVRKKKAE